MADRQLYDPTLGRSVKNATTDTCSKCGGTIPEEHVPLILSSNDGDVMWVYCEKCDGPMFARMRVPS
jgi:ribosomal protein L24E